VVVPAMAVMFRFVIVSRSGRLRCMLFCRFMHRMFIMVMVVRVIQEKKF
jgi:hypothetical protein